MAGINQLALLAAEVAALEEEIRHREYLKFAPWFDVLNDEDLQAFAEAGQLSEGERESSPAYQRALFISDLQAEIVSEGGTPADLEAALYPERIAQREAARLEQLERDRQKYLAELATMTKNREYSFAYHWLKNHGFEVGLIESPPSAREPRPAPIETPAPEVVAPPEVEQKPVVSDAPKKCPNCGTQLRPALSDANLLTCPFCGANWTPESLQYRRFELR